MPRYTTSLPVGTLTSELPQHENSVPCLGTRNCRYRVESLRYDYQHWGFMVETWRDPEELSALMEQVRKHDSSASAVTLATGDDELATMDFLVYDRLDSELPLVIHNPPNVDCYRYKYGSHADLLVKFAQKRDAEGNITKPEIWKNWKCRPVGKMFLMAYKSGSEDALYEPDDFIVDIRPFTQEELDREDLICQLNGPLSAWEPSLNSKGELQFMWPLPLNLNHPPDGLQKAPWKKYIKAYWFNLDPSTRPADFHTFFDMWRQEFELFVSWNPRLIWFTRHTFPAEKQEGSGPGKRRKGWEPGKKRKGGPVK